jgi:hypothetical protein
LQLRHRKKQNEDLFGVPVHATLTMRKTSPIAKPDNAAASRFYLALSLWTILLVTRLDQSSPLAFLTIMTRGRRRRTVTVPIQMMRLPLRHRPDDDDVGDVENRKNNNEENNSQGASSLSSSWKQEEDPISQGIVSALTAFVNAFLVNTNNKNHKTAAETVETPPPLSLSAPPWNAEELLRRIACDYTERNYLWTGELDYTCYDENCRFADPTLTFTGTATYARNIGNLRPIVDRWVDRDGGGPRSELLSIRLVVANEGDSNNNDDTSSSTSSASSSSKSFVQTRWKMVGDLRLPWRPRIDVMGQTRFWFGTDDSGIVKIYHYDETWEIPPWQALLQLVTPAGTIPNSLIGVVDGDEPNYHPK